MSEPWLNALIVIVPLLAGVALIIFFCLHTIFPNPSVPNSTAAILGIGGLLCVAPTILNLAVKLPGGTEVTLVKTLQDQGQQIKSDVGEQGARLKRQIDEIRKRVEILEKGGVAAAAAGPAEKQQYDVNKSKIVVVQYADGRQDLATHMESYLLGKGYSANSIYTDFTELAEANRLAAGTVAFVSSESDSSLRNEIEKNLRQKFPEVQTVVDATSPKLSASAVQLRLF
jgi:hypothetical protein